MAGPKQSMISTLAGWRVREPRCSRFIVYTIPLSSVLLVMIKSGLMGANTQQYGRLEKKKGLTRFTNIYRDIFLHAWDTARDERQNPSPRGPRVPWEEGRQHGVQPHRCARPSGPRAPAAKAPCAATSATAATRPQRPIAPPAGGAARQRESTFPDTTFVFSESQRASQEGRGSREDGTNQTEPRGLLVFGSS